MFSNNFDMAGNQENSRANAQHHEPATVPNNVEYHVGSWGLAPGVQSRPMVSDVERRWYGLPLSPGATAQARSNAPLSEELQRGLSASTIPLPAPAIRFGPSPFPSPFAPITPRSGHMRSLPRPATEISNSVRAFGRAPLPSLDALMAAGDLSPPRDTTNTWDAVHGSPSPAPVTQSLKPETVSINNGAPARYVPPHARGASSGFPPSHETAEDSPRRMGPPHRGYQRAPSSLRSLTPPEETSMISANQNGTPSNIPSSASGQSWRSQTQLSQTQENRGHGPQNINSMSAGHFRPYRRHDQVMDGNARRQFHPMQLSVDPLVSEDPDQTNALRIKAIKAGCSGNYKGNVDLEKNQSAKIPVEDSCSTWITYLPPNITYHELLRSIRGVGPVYQCHINEAKLHHQVYSCAAKVIFFDKATTQKFLSMYGGNGRLVIGGYRTVVEYNRILTPEQYETPGSSRVLLIHGPAAMVNKDSLTAYFKSKFYFDIDQIFDHGAGDDGNATVEYRFGSFRCQAHSGKMALSREYGGVIRCAYGVDPCA